MPPQRPRLFFGPEGLKAKWRTLLFVIGMVLSMELTLLPVNALSSRGLLRSPDAWTAGVQWAAFAAALLATLAASLLERRLLGRYGLPFRAACVARFGEGVLWGVGAASLLALMLVASRSLSFEAGALRQDALRAGALWAAVMLGIALFEQCSTRGYLQFTLARSIGFWPAAWLLSMLFALENLLSPAYRSGLGALSSALYGLLFCLTLFRTGDLWFGVGFQAALGWGMVFLYGVGTPLFRTRDALLRPVERGPSWLTGGRAGPEAGVLVVLLIGLLWIGLERRFPQQRYSTDS